MIQRKISTETMERFVKLLKQKSDCLQQEGHIKYLSPNDVSVIVDAINLWEQERTAMLSLRDLAMLNPEAHVFPNSQPNTMGLYRANS